MTDWQIIADLSFSDLVLWVPDAEAALALLREELAPGDVVLVKGSNATGLHRLGEELAGGGSADGRVAAP